MRSNHCFAASGLLAAIGLVCSHIGSEAQGRSAPDYTGAQASQGKAVYDQQCATCHGATLDNGTFAPALKGAGFLQKHGLKTVDALFDVIRTTMPPGSPGSLDASAYASILAYIFQANEIPAGPRELPSSRELLTSMIVPSRGAIPAFTPYAGSVPARSTPLDRWTPVSERHISDPGENWLTWRRAYDAHGFSPLQQITKSNVASLRVAWSWSLPVGTTESTPLVYNGTMFVYGAGDRVQALDASTGDLLWQYSRPPAPKVPRGGEAEGVQRGIAIFGDRLFVGTSDVHVVALNVKTGQVMWDQQIGDRSVREGLTSGPIVGKGKVMIGTTGTLTGSKPGGPKIVGLDVATGRIAWQVHTIAQPGQPGGNSWNGVPVEKRTGASVWTPGSYNPQLGLAFFGTGNTYDTGPLTDPVKQPGVTNELLYTNTTLAINPDSGRLVWYYQHHPHELWDMDWAFERQLVRLPVGGTPRTVVVTMGKAAIYEGVDAESGRYLFSIDAGLQNLITAIDPETGAKTVDPALVPRDGKLKIVCPHAVGAKNWMPGSYNPNTKTAFVGLVAACMDLFPVPTGPGTGALTSGYSFSVRPRADDDGQYGRLQAINLETRKTVWTVRQRAPQTSGVLATAGGLVFTGSQDRYLRAHDDATGKVLWETRLNDVLSSPPITYAVNGKQYLAIVAGRGAYHPATHQALVPELKNPTDRTSSLWVFELPER